MFVRRDKQVIAKLMLYKYAPQHNLKIYNCWGRLYKNVRYVHKLPELQHVRCSLSVCIVLTNTAQEINLLLQELQRNQLVRQHN